MTDSTKFFVQNQGHRFCVAPMMEWTDRHCRYLHRILTRHTLLYTEMITSGAIIHGDRARLLGFDPVERPVALQLGGAEPDELAEAAKIGADFGYDEINLNVGCPSDRVKSGRFGACLMAEPALVARCLHAMQDAVDRPVTVKCRIGIDAQDTEADLDRFVETVATAGTTTVIVHARKAWLEGLSAKQNREIPPLDYDRVYRLKDTFPDLRIVVNGGVASLAAAAEHIAHVDGVMMGRSAYHQPYLLADVDRLIFNDPTEPPTRAETIERLVPYVERALVHGTRLNQITRHILGLYHGQPGARAFRRHLSENAWRPGAGTAILTDAIAHIQSPPGAGLSEAAE